MLKRNKKGTKYIEEEGTVLAKECTKCGVMKNLNEFNTHPNYFAGRLSMCKECKREYRAKNKSHINKYMRKWTASNREKVRVYQSSESARNSRKRYYENNKKFVISNVHEWKKRNKTRVAIYNHNRYAKKKNLPNDFKLEHIAMLSKRFGNSCALTGDKGPIDFDHFIPLSSGFGGTYLGNIIPLRSDLNKSKKDSNPFEWFKENKERFNLDQGKFDDIVRWLAELNEMTIVEYQSYVYACFADKRISDGVKPNRIVS